MSVVSTPKEGSNEKIYSETTSLEVTNLKIMTLSLAIWYFRQNMVKSTVRKEYLNFMPSERK